MLSASEPLSLSHAYELALKNEPKLQSYNFKVLANAQSVNQIQARYYPQVQGTMSWGRYEYTAEYLTKGAVKENYTDYSLSASQAIYHPEVWRGIDQAKTKQKAAEEQYNAEAQKLGLDLTKAYFLLLRENKTVELTLSQKEYYEQKYKQQEEMLKFGLTNRIDLLETKIEKDKSTSQWLIEQKRAHVAKLRLENFIGEKVEELKPFDFANINTAKLALERSEWETKIQNSPSLQAAHYNVQVAEDEVAIRQYDHYPKVDFSLTRKETNTNDTIAHTYDNQAVIRLNLPIYTGGYTQSKVKEGMLQLDSAKKERDYYLKDTQARFEETWEERQYTIENFKTIKESEISAELFLESNEKAYTAGLKSIVDVLEARAKLYTIKRDLIDAGYELINNHLTLLDISGELNVENIGEYENLIN
jgi:outer membrane protein